MKMIEISRRKKADSKPKKKKEKDIRITRSRKRRKSSHNPLMMTIKKRKKEVAKEGVVGTRSPVATIYIVSFIAWRPQL